MTERLPVWFDVNHTTGFVPVADGHTVRLLARPVATGWKHAAACNCGWEDYGITGEGVMRAARLHVRPEPVLAERYAPHTKYDEIDGGRGLPEHGKLIRRSWATPHVRR